MSINTTLKFYACFCVNLPLPLYPCIAVAATVALEEHDYSFCEGNGTVEVCVKLMQTPTGGLQCSIVVDLSLTDGAKAGKIKYTDHPEKPDHM